MLVLDVEEQREGQARDQRKAEMKAVDEELVRVNVEQRRVQRVDLDEDVSVEREETGEEGTDDDVGDDFLAEVVLVISRGRSCVNLDAVADELSGDVELGPILLN